MRAEQRKECNEERMEIEEGRDGGGWEHRRGGQGQGTR